MASEQHITLLRQGFKVWNKWRQQNPEIIPELKAADLTGLKLFKVDLAGADLSEADFSGTSLYKANLSGANLCKANLSTAILQEADLSGASLIEANLKDKQFFQTNLSGANLSRANLSGAKFYRTNLSGADLSGQNLSEKDLSETNFSRATLSETNFSRANLRWTNLAGANLTGTNLNKADLKHANLRQARIQETTIDEKWYLVWDIVTNGAEGRDIQGLDLSMADLEGANLSKADLRNVNLSMADLEGADLSEADLHNANLTGTKLNRANLAKSNLVKANLTQADINMANLRMVNLRESNLCEANFRGSDLSEADFSKANLKYAKLHCTQIQKAVIDKKWYLVWDIVNNGAEGRDLSKVDLSEADLSEANFKKGNLSSTDLSRSILNGSDLSRTNLSGANFRKANLAGANFAGVDFSEVDLSEAQGFDSITWNGASVLEVSRGMAAHSNTRIRDKKEFFENLFSWKNQEVFNESIKKSLFSSGRSLIPGVLLYTDEDYELSLYVRKHFDALDKLTGDWCTIYLLENPSPKWLQASQNLRKAIGASLHTNWFGGKLYENWFRSKPYDKSEAYDIARQLNVESSSLPCLVLISPTNLSEKLVLQIREISPEYFRKLFSTLEKLVKRISSEKLSQKEASSQVFDYLKLNFNEIVNFLEKYASKQEENNSTKYILKGDNISISIEPVNIGNINYNEKIEGNYVQGDNTDQSRNLKVGDVGGDFKPIGSALMADGFRASSTVAESTNFDKGMPEGAELQNQQDEDLQA